MTSRGYYIAGPMRGIPEFNFPAFFEAEDYLYDMCLGPDDVLFNPARRDVDQYGTDLYHEREGDLEEIPWFDLQEAMKADLDFIVNHCTSIVMLPGWSQSSGAIHEKATAEVLGQTVLYYHPEKKWGFRLQVEPCLEDVGDTWPVQAPTSSGGNTEVRMTDPDTGAQKGSKRARFDLIPVGPLWELAEHYGKGGEKYADRNWERGYDWHLSFSALMRHAWAFWDGEDIDPETGTKHIIAAAWQCFALAEFMDTHPEKDNRVKWQDQPTPLVDMQSDFEEALRQQADEVYDAWAQELTINWGGQWTAEAPARYPYEKSSHHHDWTVDTVYVEKPDTRGGAARDLNDEVGAAYAKEVADAIAEEEERNARWERHWKLHNERQQSWHARANWPTDAREGL